MVRLRKNVKRFWAQTSPPVYTPLQIPLSSMNSQYDHPSQNLMYLSPSVFIPPSAHLQFLSTSQPVPILSSSDPSQASFRSLTSAPPLVFNPFSTSSLFTGNPQSLDAVVPSCSLDLSPSVHDLEQLFQNLSLGPPPEFNPKFAHAQYQYTPQPSDVSFSVNMGLHSPTTEDDDMRGEVEPPLCEPMDICGSIAKVIQDDTTHISTSAMSRNHFGICTSLPYPLIAQLHPAFPVCDARPALFPETYHPLPQLPTIYDDLHKYSASPVDAAHISTYSSTPVYPSCNDKKTTVGCSINETTLFSPAHLFDHSLSLREFEEQTALKWFAEEIACIRSIDSRPHSRLSPSESLSPSINVADPIHTTHSPATFHLSPGPWRAVTTVKDAVRRMQRKQVLSCEQSYLTQILLGQTTPKAKDKNTVQQSLRMRRSDHTHYRNSPLSPEDPNNSSGSFSGQKRKRLVERAEGVNGDRQMKRLRVAAQVVPAAIFKISASVLKVPAEVLLNITSTVAKTYFAVTKGLKSAAGKIVASRPRAKPPPEVIIIDDDDD
ncbi:hypothetical protein C0993_010953 [Termitomyces sp. T159_Od127]|nr:hypothetical protein C0993_010953 [Termitomyces sp. T159_Od127]